MSARPCLLLLAALALLPTLPACSAATLEDDEVCRGVRCTAGTCYSRGGAPVCECDALEEALGLTCRLDTGPDPLGNVPQSTLGAGKSGTFTLPRPPNDPGDPRRVGLAFDVPAGHVYQLELSVPGGSGFGTTTILWPGGGTAPTRTALTRSSLWAKAQGAPLRVTFMLQHQVSAPLTYTWRLRDLGADAYGDTPADAPALSGDALSLASTFSVVDDVDTVRVSVPAAGSLYASCRPTGGTYGLAVQLLDAQGQRVTGEPPQTVDGELRTLFLGLAQGPHVLQVSTPTPQEDGTGGFTCEVTTRDDVGGTDAQARVLTGSGDLSVQGCLDYPGDVDVYAVDAPANRLYVVPMDQTVSVWPSRELLDPTVNSPWPIYQLLHWAQAGRVFLRVSQPSGAPLQCPYTVRLRDHGLDDHDSTGEYPSFFAESGAPGRIDFADDVDVFTQYLGQGTHTFVAETGDVVLRIVSPWTGVLATQEPGPTRTQVAVTEPGYHRVEVRARSAQTTSYRIRLEAAAP